MIDIDYFTSKLYQNKYTIFLFHGVINTSDTEIRNYTNKHILGEDFESLLLKLKKMGTPLSLDEVIDYYEKNISLPEYSYSITFDDGFENNYSVAVPILEKLVTPATFYVSTNLIDNNLMSWIDKIEYCFELKDNFSIYLPWNKDCIKLNNNKLKIRCLDEIRKNVKENQNIYVPEDIVKLVFDQCDMDIILSNNHPLDKKMNWKQVKEIHSHELFSIGGHSHNHISLGLLDEDVLKKEIETSIQFLKSKAGISPFHYSYPEGQKIDMNNNVKRLLQKNNIKCCPTAIDGLNSLKPKSLFDLNRIMVY